MVFITPGSLYFELFLVHDPRWPHVARSLVRPRLTCLYLLLFSLIFDFRLLADILFCVWFTLVVLSRFHVHSCLDYVACPPPPTHRDIHYNGPGFRLVHHGTGFGVDFNKLKSVRMRQWVTKGIRRSDYSGRD